jgi:hypothetical protein
MSKEQYVMKVSVQKYLVHHPCQRPCSVRTATEAWFSEFRNNMENIARIAIPKIQMRSPAT